MELTHQDICFDHQIRTKEQALARVAQQLSNAGFTRPEYLTGMQQREAQISTYLGNGIAIPHGTPESRGAVIKTGVSVVVCPQGIPWEDGQMARLIVGIAAQDNEHLNILRQLTHALSDERVPDALARATCPQSVMEILAGKITANELNEAPKAFDTEATFTLHNPHGLHARPGAVLVHAVKQWQAEILVENLDTHSAPVDAKNLMRVIALGAKQGHRLHFMARGVDAHQALQAIGSAFEAGLGEIAAQRPGCPAPAREKRSWLTRLFS